jgi:hypothetical protein
MISSPEPFAELQLLLDCLCEGTLDESAVARLQTLVIADKSASHFYRTYLQLHGALRLQTFPAFPPLSDILNRAHLRESQRQAPSLALGFFGNVFQSSINSALIRTLLVALAIYGVFGFLAWNLRPSKVPGLAEGNLEGVAVVHNTTGVQWSQGISSKSAKSSVLSGEPLKIESGVIELELNTGTKLIVEGPADWSVDGENSVLLRAGKLVAHVPQQAIGFTVETPTAKVVDLGTEFGVDVDDQGTAVHVFEGRVVAQFAGESGGAQRRIELKTSEAARFGVGAATLSKLTGAPERFQRAKSATATKTTSVQPDAFKGLQLWLKADAGVYSTFSDDGDYTNDTPAEPGQSVQGWRDFSGHNRHPLQPTLEHRPKLELNARQRPILRFEGDQWLERSGLVLNHADPSSFTIFAAFEIAALPDDARNSGSALMALFGQFSSAGDTSRYFGITSQGCLFHAEYRGDPNTVFFGQGRAIVPQRAQIGVLIREGGPRALYAIAPGEGEIVTRSERSENYIGAAPILWRVGARWHPQTHEMFRGEIAEMLVYDRALSKSEQRHIEQYLANKFFAGSKTPAR